MKRALRQGLGFRRIALVLSGGGALGAYAVGVLRALEDVGLRPQIIAAVSVGAFNAVVWTAHDFSTAALERTWSRLTPAGIGLRWLTLGLRILGGFVMVLALFELVLTLTGSSELSIARLYRTRAVVPLHTPVLLDAMAWLVIGMLGYAIAGLSREAEDWIVGATPTVYPSLWPRIIGGLLLGGLVVHLITWGYGIPWPHRFSATALVVLFLAWIANRPGGSGERTRALLLRLLPETRGRGLWRGRARRHLLERLVKQGDASRLTLGGPHLIIGACALDSGRVCQFINWQNPSPEFRESVDRHLGEVVVASSAQGMVDAAVASTAIPIVFEPVTIQGREFVDAGALSNQPIHAVIADGADAVMVVLVSPSSGPRKPEPGYDLFGLGARLLELANWRDLQTELLNLPPGWSREGNPARLCVIEPETVLPGGLLRFGPANAAELMARGRSDAFRALDRAGWLEPGSTTRVS